jgi:dipeptidyl aminopeptidase/acylaminoacyl peptidase
VVRAVDARLIVAREALIDELDLSADGELVVYGRRTTVADADVRRLWTVPFGGGRPRPLTTGRHLDHTPRIAPDRSAVAFLSDRETRADQVWLVPLGGGEPRRLTSFRRGATDLAWSADSRSLAVAAHDDASHLDVGERAGGEPTARVLRRLDWRDDDSYGLLRWPVHVHRVPLRGRPRRLTSGAWSARRPGFLPDGRVAFLADLRPDGDLLPLPQLHAVPLDGGPPEPVSSLPGPVIDWTVADGEVVCLAHDVPAPRDADPSLAVRLGDGAAVGGDRDAFAVHVRGRAHVVHRGGQEVVGLDDGRVLARVAGAEPIAAAGERVAAVLVDGTGAGDVYALEPDRPPRRLTRHGGDWVRRALGPAPEIDELRIEGIPTYLLSPPAAAGALPTVLAIHGGPTWHWTPAVELGLLCLVAAGYRVALPNIRGSYGFGYDWVDALRGDWGGVDAADCHTVCDHLVASGATDAGRLGCFGRSYGGFLVNWLVGTSLRFAAAVSECGVANNVSAYGQADCGATYNRAAGLGEAISPEGVAALWRQSPLRHAAAIHTPLLLLQGEADLRCPTADVEQLFVALRWLGREVEYVLYPEGGHAYHRLGRPDRRADRHARLVGWFQRHMPA